jgi:16S rRNA (guanine966-N2)-methyltransferase
VPGHTEAWRSEERLMSTRISGGNERGRTVQAPKSGLRPTTEKVRAAIFSMLRESVVSARVLDLYAGTGAMGLEALSRGAAWADFVEGDARACSTISANIRSLGYEDRARVMRAKVEKVIGSPATLPGSSPGGHAGMGGRNGTRYDLVFIDPPYDDDPWDELLSGLSDGSILSTDATVIAEYSSGRDLAASYGRLTLTKTRRYGVSTISIFTLTSADGTAAHG